MSHSEETKLKISLAIKKKWEDEEYREKNTKSLSKASKSKAKRKKISQATKRNWKNGIYENRETFKLSHKMTYLQSLKDKHPFFFKIENPKIDFKKLIINVKCKTCKTFFEPSYNQLYERMRAIENPGGIEENNFYCSDECKIKCSVYRKRNGDLNINKTYTSNEYQQFREYVLERDKYKCQYCEKKAIIVHHERPQKLEPFFSLDPDFGWSVCRKCHYEKGHVIDTECSIGNLSNRICN
jgi:hypothetical protein